MVTHYMSRAYDHLLEYLIEKATPEEILAFSLSDTDKQRAIELLDKQDEDALTPDEIIELEQMREAELLIMALRAKALDVAGKQ